MKIKSSLMFKGIAYFILSLLLIQCVSEKEKFQIEGNWQGYSPQDGYYEVVIDGERIHVHSSLFGISTIDYHVLGDSLVMGSSGQKISSAMLWEEPNHLRLQNATHDESIFRLDSKIKTHLNLKEGANAENDGYMTEFLKRGKEFTTAHGYPWEVEEGR